MHDFWLSTKVEEIHNFADRYDMMVSRISMVQYCLVHPPPHLDANGTILLTDKEILLGSLAEHFEGVINRLTYAIDRLTQVPLNK